MGQSNTTAGVLAGLTTIVGLGFVWGVVFANLPSGSQFTANAGPEAPGSTGSTGMAPPVELPLAQSTVRFRHPNTLPRQPDEPRLSVRSAPSDRTRKSMEPDGLRRLQAAELKCEAELEHRCGDLSSKDRKRCIETQMSRLTQCRVARERLARWKEERTKDRVACDEDVRRFCKEVQPGGGRIRQCLMDHAQEVSERCYDTLPKGSLTFKN